MPLRRSGLFLSIFFVFVTCQVQQPPHVVIIVADDLGWNDVSYHDPVHQIPTPNIDALGLNGVILNRHYSQQMCTPSRAALMTGKYPIKTGMQHFVIVQDEPWGLPLNEKILPEFFKDGGYETYMVGKWHLGFHKKEFTPLERGFDHHYGYWGSNIDYWTKFKALRNITPGLDFRNGADLEWNDDQYATESFTNVVKKYIREHDKTKPMLMVMNHLAPHSANPKDPLQAPEDEINKFSFISDINRRKHAAMVSLLDKSIGEVITELKKFEMLQNSVIVFMSDNGAPTTPPIELNPGSNYPLRGTKNTPWEAGVRVPAMIWSPLLQTKAKINNNLFHISDWLPTLLTAANISYNQSTLDGVNHWMELTQSPEIPSRNELLVNIDPIDDWSAVIKDNFKLVYKRNRDEMDNWLSSANVETALDDDLYSELVQKSEVFKALESQLTKEEILSLVKSTQVQCSSNEQKSCNFSDNFCLFNIQDDPCEFHDLGEKYPDQLKDLKKTLNEYKKLMVKPLNEEGDERRFFTPIVEHYYLRLFAKKKTYECGMKGRPQ
ncbi:arylsulfatase B-like [Culicoides brevitarsis]|uniref:arylsulfatase B-like n=1 Tax=Culicoides brevitarsis TaxID=469753 RepID=UPI00307C8D4B